jgi:putative hydrolase of the HAD superfamily
VIEAVLFDWGDTLMPYDAQADDAFILARTEAGLAALEGRVDVEPEAVTGWFRDNFDELFASDAEEDFDHLEMLGRCFRELGADPSDDDVRLYAQASNWEGEMLLFPQAHALLDSLRDRGLKTALVSNTSVPGWLLAPVLEKQGLASRIDAAVFSSDVGKRKPHPLIFECAVQELRVEAPSCLFVGDRLRQDVRGARDAGMVTVQALWERVDEHPDGAEPDYEAYTMMDVLNVVLRLNGGR